MLAYSYKIISRWCICVEDVIYVGKFLLVKSKVTKFCNIFKKYEYRLRTLQPHGFIVFFPYSDI